MEKCFDQLLRLSFTSACIKLFISKVLSVTIITLSMTVKVPQIKNMMQTKHVKGLSYISMYVEILAFTLNFLYSYHYRYPLSTYVENLIILTQNLIILFLAWKYDQAPVSRKDIYNRCAIILGYVMFIFIAMSNLMIPDVAWPLIGSSGSPLISISRISQIISTYKEKSTGPLSFFTFLMNMFGVSSRIFTNIQETGDKILICNGIYALSLNLIIVIQILYYGDKEGKRKIK